METKHSSLPAYLPTLAREIRRGVSAWWERTIARYGKRWQTAADPSVPAEATETAEQPQAAHA
jgi:hypothetical protein